MFLLKNTDFTHIFLINNMKLHIMTSFGIKKWTLSNVSTTPHNTSQILY